MKTANPFCSHSTECVKGLMKCFLEQRSLIARYKSLLSSARLTSGRECIVLQFCINRRAVRKRAKKHGKRLNFITKRGVFGQKSMARRSFWYTECKHRVHNIFSASIHNQKRLPRKIKSSNKLTSAAVEFTLHYSATFKMNALLKQRYVSVLNRWLHSNWMSIISGWAIVIFFQN